MFIRLNYCKFGYKQKTDTMENKQIIERFGGIIKEEPLSCIQDDIILPNTCVLEADSPYFGYYSYEPQTKNPQHLYCALNGYFSLETIARATQNVRKNFDKSFDAAIGSVTVSGNTCQIIRIRNLHHYNYITDIQRLYLEEGITFKKKPMKVKNSNAMIKLRKFFTLQVLEDNIYIDNEEESHIYFKIPQQIEWDFFKEITDKVRLNSCDFYFDAALAFMYEKDGVADMIRVYSKNFTVDKIYCIKSLYLDNIE